MTKLYRILVCVLLMAAMGSSTAGDVPIPFPKPRDVNTHHSFTPPATKGTWEKRAEELRQQILFSTGLYPMPEKAPLNPRVTGTFEGPDFFVDNVALETYPGFFLCGNLYRPKGKKGPFPGIVNPHGHWANGRLHIEPDVPKAEPAPAKPAPGKGNLVAIGVNLARQGFVCFSYDMCGYNDTNQIPDHRKFCNSLEPWLWNVSLNGLQLWNSVRVVDYLESRKDVDKDRIGCTGASGGGTQTFELCAIDPRIACAVPVNMISAYMQGGCLCENAPGLRVGTDNVEIGALFAPKPLLLIAATGDWTSKVPVEEWPAIQKVYDLYGKGDHTACQQFNYGHNYNLESREAMYAWFGRWFLKDPNPDHFREKSFEIDTKILHVWDDKTPRPTDAITEAKLEESLKNDCVKRIEAIWPHDKGSLKNFQETMRPALSASLAIDSVEPSRPFRASHNERAILIVTDSQEKLPEKVAKILEKQSASVEFLRLPPSSTDPKNEEKMWKDFFVTYNRSFVGERANIIAAKIAGLKKYSNIKEIDVIGLEGAAIPALLARAIEPVDGRVAIDCNAFNNTDDKAFIEKYYSPGLRRAGDVKTAAMLIAPSPLCLFNTGDAFKTDEIAKGYKSVKAQLRVEKGALSTFDIGEWISAK